MRSKQYYQRLTDSITDELMRRQTEHELQDIRSNKDWYLKFARTLGEVTKAVWERLSSDIIEGRLIQCAAVIFAWIEHLDDS